jgi:16S rRNA (guanine527-N7)-methyltransferase
VTDDFRRLLRDHAAGRGLDRLVRYAELLERWGRRHNLVRWTGRQELVRRHIVESLAARELLPDCGRLLDIGSGAGLPGIPILAVLEGWRGVLLEPREKRWTFLRVVIRELELDAAAVASRYQDYDGEGGPFDVVTVRALGRPRQVLDWVVPHLTARGQVVVWSTVAGESELREHPGWRVLSSPLRGLDRGRLVQLRPCFT